METTSGNDTLPFQPRSSQMTQFWTSATAAQDLPTILERAVGMVASKLGFDACAVFKLSPDRNLLRVVSSLGWPEDGARAGEIPAGLRSQEGYALVTNRAVTSLDLRHERRFAPAPAIANRRFVSGISVVIQGETRPFGVLSGYTSEVRHFSATQIDFMQSVAHILTENVRRLHADRDRAQLAAVVESASDAIVSATAEGIIFSWNRAAQEMFGFEQADVLGKRLEMLFPPGCAPRRRPECEESGCVGPYETICERRDGQRFDVEISISPIASAAGTAAAQTFAIRDRTQRIKHERALRTHADLLGHMHIGVVVCRLDDPDAPESLRITLANYAGAEAAGFALETSQDRRLADIRPANLTEDDLARCAEVARTGRLHHFGDRTVDAGGGNACTYDSLAFPLPDQSVGVVFHDVTAQRQLADQLQHAQRMEVIGRLAGGVAHDFNNLLTVIGGCAEMLQQRLGHDVAMHEDVRQIQQAAESASALTSQLLTFSRRQVCRPGLVNLSALVGRVRGMLRRLIGEDVQLNVLSGPQPPMACADAAQLEQVLFNLAVNARDAMPDGGRLLIETDIVRLPAEHALRLGGASPGAYATLTVADTGLGMDQWTRERIFEPFFTTKETGRGTGLGLSMVYGIVRQNNGFIEVESEPGEGTIMKVYLPLAEQAPAEIAASARPVSSRAGSETILVVEDEESVRGYLRRLLSTAGYSVLVANNPREAMTIASQRTQAFDLLLTDVVMPQETGRNLAARLAAANPRLRVLYMSGYPDDATTGRTGEPLAPFIAKPFSSQQLLGAVRAALDPAEDAAAPSAPATIH